MTSSKGRAPVISLGDDFGTAVVQGGGITVELSDNGDVTVHTNGNVKLRPASNDDAKPVTVIEPQIGEVMPAGHPNAGYIYAGISKTTHQPFYVAPKDSGVFQWKEAMAFAAKNGSRLPSKDELNQIYGARDKGALKGTFNLTSSRPAGWYWSSSPSSNLNGWAQRLSDGLPYGFIRSLDSSLRLVR
jgi:hypothetical protein